MPRIGRFALFALALASPAHAQIAAPVAVDGGQVAGTVDGKVAVYKGIPFANAPVGELRWQPPQPVQSWEGVRTANEFGPDCPQLGAVSSSHSAETLPPGQSEDCLYLNIWSGAQSAEERRPVMVWIYGGGYRAGSTRLPIYDGAALARQGVVLVSIAYRVGPLGFMAHPALSAESPQHVSGNYGLLDQIAALDWIRRNIASFGGDPDRITIFGQSAGSMSTSYLASSPLAAGKFHRLIGQTGAGFGILTPKPLAEAEGKGLAFGEEFGARTAEELRGISAAKMVAAAGFESGTFQPIVDGWAVPAELRTIYRQGRQNDVAMLIGSNEDEARINPSLTLAGYREGVEALYGEDARRLLELNPASTDAEARAADKRLSTATLGDYTMFGWGRAQATTGTAPVYTYRFTRNPPIPKSEYPGGPDASPPGAWHGAEIPYAFDNLPARDWPWTERDRELSRQIMTYWINFAATGDPNGPGLPQWPTYRQEPGKVMELGDQTAPIRRPNLPTLEILDRHLGR